MKILFYFVMLCALFLWCISFYLSFIKLVSKQRFQLLALYSKIFFSLERNYKEKEKSALFRTKEDFMCFKEGLRWFVPYVYGEKKWGALSNWELGMAVKNIIDATNKYPSSSVTKLINENILEIMKRSIVLLFPLRINLFMKLDNNENNKFVVGNVDLTAIKEELQNNIHTVPDTQKSIRLNDYINFIRRIKNRFQFFPLYYYSANSSR